jgi:hypothetical protein
MDAVGPRARYAIESATLGNRIVVMSAKHKAGMSKHKIMMVSQLVSHSGTEKKRRWCGVGFEGNVFPRFCSRLRGSEAV